MAPGGSERALGAFAGDGKLSGAGAPRKAGAIHRHLDKLEKWEHEKLARSHKGRGQVPPQGRGNASGTASSRSPLARAAPRGQSPGPGLGPRCHQGAAERSPPAGAGPGR